MAKLYSYTLEHFFRDFTEEEIVDGVARLKRAWMNRQKG